MSWRTSSSSNSQNEWDLHPLNKHHRTVLESIPKSWMLRECDRYKDEYNGCSSIKGKFYSYYIDGKFSSCDEWKKNYKDCKLWVSNTDKDAAKRVIEREEKRISERLRGHYQNDIWESRAKDEIPPADWDKPLPDHLAEAAEDSYLKQYEDSQKDDQDVSSTVLQLRALTARTSTALPECIIL